MDVPLNCVNSRNNSKSFYGNASISSLSLKHSYTATHSIRGATSIHVFDGHIVLHCYSYLRSCGDGIERKILF